MLTGSPEGTELELLYSNSIIGTVTSELPLTKTFKLSVTYPGFAATRDKFTLVVTVISRLNFP
ncbi:MAG: hypothetical protein A2455_11245 [Ignavibacteria bacterium RIFOXYC2_FULL_35_16]|nr:MAG: hypothetical protein A2455_11245 [Ignavibacteria bacterium RIFOXYC2_FULL_35_16]